MFAGRDGIGVHLRNHNMWIGAAELPQCIYASSSAQEDPKNEPSSTDHTGALFWPCSYLMALVLERNMGHITGPVLELGAGTGLCSCILAQGGLDVIATDRDEMALINLIIVAERNGLCDRMHISQLIWGDSASLSSFSSRFKTIVGSDIIYAGQPRESMNQILDTIHQLLDDDGEAWIAFVQHPGSGKIYSLNALLQAIRSRGYYEVMFEDICEDMELCKQQFPKKDFSDISKYSVLRLRRMSNNNNNNDNHNPHLTAATLSLSQLYCTNRCNNDDYDNNCGSISIVSDERFELWSDT